MCDGRFSCPAQQLNQISTTSRDSNDGMWFRWGPTHRHSCQKCGFLAFRSNQFFDKVEDEADTGVRRVVAADGENGWFEREDSVDCYRHLWDWEPPPPAAAVDIITYEANRPRFHCSGFHKYSPGRSPAAHLTLENELRGYRQQRRLATLSFFGAVIGAAIGAAAALLSRLM
jgi:hypothetical protein